ncbi:MAG: hypothetical protein L6R40_002820 [Gallowayella cf. fulva]|nr:MAG: hypothetical protein L6R40_002820 [Xanthomendoza cf. fulva]
MTTSHLSTEDFFTRLSSLFHSRRNSTHGSIFLTQKRCAIPSAHIHKTSVQVTPTLIFVPTSTAVFPDLSPSSPLPILIRASDGKSKERRKEKVKISTIVQPDELEGFFTRYAEVMKGGTTALKKRDRSGRKKATKAKKKGKGGGAGEGEKK